MICKLCRICKTSWILVPCLMNIFDRFFDKFWQIFDKFLTNFVFGQVFWTYFWKDFWTDFDRFFGQNYNLVRFKIEVALIWFSFVLWNGWISKLDFCIMDHSGARDMWLSQQWQPQGIPELLSTFASQLEIY